MRNNQNVTEGHELSKCCWKKWRQQTCPMQTCHNPSICKKRSICKVQQTEAQESHAQNDVISARKKSNILLKKYLIDLKKSFIDSERHNKNKASFRKIEEYEGNAFLGIDAGSTTTKLVLITDKGEILYSYYGSNNGNSHSGSKFFTFHSSLFT